MDYKLKPTYKLTDNDIYGLFRQALTSGSIGYGVVVLDCSKEVYNKAREAVKILKAGSPEDYVKGNYYICVEDVWTQVFKAGELLYIEHDFGDDWSGTPVPVTMDNVYDNLNRMQDNEPWILEEFYKEEDDANTHDAFLQCLLLGEIVYG